MEYHGIRYALDLNDSRQYAIRYVDGRPNNIQSFARDERDNKIGKNEVIFAVDDGSDARSMSESADGGFTMETVLYQFTTDENGKFDGLKQMPVTYNVDIQQIDTDKYQAVYAMTDESQQTLKDAGFDQSVPKFFKEPVDANNIGDDDTFSLIFPPHHVSMEADVARHMISISAPEDDTAVSAPQSKNTPNTPKQPANNSGKGGLPQRKEQKPPRYERSDIQIEGLLKQFGDDISARVAEGKSDPVLERDEETRKALTSMMRKKKSSMCFVGEAGVGKSAMFEAVAQEIAKGNVPEQLQNARVIQLHLQSMNAGAKFRGDFEKKLMPILEGLKERGGYLNGQKVILAIDEIHSALTSGKAEGGTDAGNIMKPFLASEGICVMGTTTWDEYRKHIEKDPALSRRFEAVEVKEPNLAVTRSILQGAWEVFKEHHGMTQDISDSDLDFIINTTGRFMPDRHQPDKALDVLDQACAEAVMNGRDHVTRDDLINVVSVKANVDSSFLKQDENERYIKLEENLNKDVLDQPEAAQAVGRRLAMARAGLADPNKPFGCFVFEGPTGVGKTEMVKSLARNLFGSEEALIKLDMAEYSEKHSVSRLTGAPPGYVGFEDAKPALTEQVRKRPYSVLLLDEVEKAHPDVFNVLLSVLNDGKMKDNHDKEVRFNNVVIVMTTNNGAKPMGDTEIGFGTDHKTPEEIKKENKQRYEKARGKFFRPEMIGRIEGLGGFVTFNSLQETTVRQILEREVSELSDRLKNNPIGMQLDNLSVQVGKQAQEQLMKEGFKPELGARPMQGAVSKHFTEPLSEWLLQNVDKVKSFIEQNGQAKIIVSDLDNFKPKLQKVAKSPKKAATTAFAKQGTNDNTPKQAQQKKPASKKKANNGPKA